MPASSCQARHHEIFGDAHNQHREGANHQGHKSRKNKNMDDSSRSVARMLPLSQPKFQEFPQPGEWPVEAKIGLGPQERSQAFCHDISKTCDSQKMNDQEQASPRG